MPKYYEYEVTYRIHNGYQYNEPNGYEETTETIRASSPKEAYSIALKRAETPSLIAHDPVTVFKKDIRRTDAKGLKKYNVRLYFHTSVDIEVYAENERQAVNAAYSVSADKKYERAILESLVEDGAPDVEEQ